MNYVKKSNNQFYKKKLRKTNPSLYCFRKYYHHVRINNVFPRPIKAIFDYRITQLLIQLVHCLHFINSKYHIISIKKQYSRG